MNTIFIKGVFLGLLFTLLACNSNSSSDSALESIDLMKYGLPIVIKAPVGATVESSDLGFVKDVTVKSEDNFYLQIIGGNATTTQHEAIKNEHISEVKQSEYFDEILSEDEHGFIFRKKITEKRINHDFRYIKIQGNMEYVFQTGLIGQYSLEDVQLMYKAVQ